MCLLYGSSTGPAGIGRHEDLGFFSETLVRLPRSGASSGGNQEFKCWVYRRTLRAVVILVFSGKEVTRRAKFNTSGLLSAWGLRSLRRRLQLTVACGRVLHIMACLLSGSGFVAATRGRLAYGLASRDTDGKMTNFFMVIFGELILDASGLRLPRLLLVFEM